MYPKNILKLGAYAGYFKPEGEWVSSIYKEDVVYGVKLGVRVWNNLSIWLNGMQYRKTGKTVPLEDITTVTLNPIYLSLRYTFVLGAFNPYLEGGFTYIYFNEESEIGTTKSEGRGFSADAGIELKLSSHFVIDVGVKYSKISVNPTNFDVQLGGLQAGVAFLVVF